MRSEKCLDADTALSDKVVKSSLRQEIIRRLTNTHLEVPIFEKIGILDRFYWKMRHSGHEHEKILTLYVEALLKFNYLVKLSKLPENDPSYRPLYMSNDYKSEERKMLKFLKRFNWHDPTTSATDNAWKQEIPTMLRDKIPNSGRSKQKLELAAPTSVFFVPNSHKGVLIRNLERAEPLLTRLSGYRV